MLTSSEASERDVEDDPGENTEDGAECWTDDEDVLALEEASSSSSYDTSSASPLCSSPAAVRSTVRLSSFHTPGSTIGPRTSNKSTSLVPPNILPSCVARRACCSGVVGLKRFRH